MTQNRFAATVLRNSAFGFVAQFAIKVLSFTFNVVVIRLLGTEAFGQYAAVGAFGALFVFLADLGLSVYAIREFARWRDQPDGFARSRALFSNMLVLRLALTLLTAALMLGAAWLTGRPWVMIGGIAINALTLLAYTVLSSSQTLLAGYERLDLNAGNQVLQQVIFLLVSAAALWLGFGYYGLLVANLLSVALVAYASWRNLRTIAMTPGPVALGTWLPLLRASLPFGIINLALGLSAKFDSVLLNITRSDAETGLYSAAYNLIFSIQLFSNVINTALYPSLTREAAAAPAQLNSVAARVLRYLLIVSLPIAFGGWALAGQGVRLLYGDGYAGSDAPLQILIWAVPFMYLSEFLGYLVVVRGQEARVARAVVVSSSFNVLLNLILIPRYGLVAAAILTVITEVMLVAQHSWALRDLLRQIRPGPVIARILLSVGLMTAVVVAIRTAVPFAVSVTAGALICGAGLWLSGVVSRDDLNFMRRIRAGRCQVGQPEVPAEQG